MEIALVSAILIAMVVLLVSETLPVDLTAIGVIVVLMVTRTLTPTEAIGGFANPAVITVGAMFLVSRAMIRSGVIGFIGEQVFEFTGGRKILSLLVVFIIIAVASAFINNTPVVVLFIPIIMRMGCQFGISPSKLLIPVSYVSILAGTCTLIGTSTNLIVSDLSALHGYGAISMFELSWVGLPLAIAGCLLIAGLAPKFMPDLINPTCELNDEKQRRYLSELAVLPKSAFLGLDPCTVLTDKYPGVEVVQLIRHSRIYHPCRDSIVMAPNDLLLVKGSPSQLVNILNDKDFELPKTDRKPRFNGPESTLVVELIIPPQSDLIGRRLKETHLARDENLQILAIERIGLHYSEKQIQDIRLKIGDILLVHCGADQMDRFRNRSDWIVAEDVHHEIVHHRKARVAGMIFGGLVIAASTGLADIMVCSLVAVFLMLLTGCLSLKDAYAALQPNVLLLIAGTIALGVAMEKTGASRYYAEIFLDALEGWSPGFILGGLILMTSLSTQVLSNNATAVLLIPIAISTAVGLGVSPKPFIMAVCFGASACFATPIGYQTNLMVYGPGGYRFSDYLKMGIPLNLLVVVGATIFVPYFWPF